MKKIYMVSALLLPVILIVALALKPQKENKADGEAEKGAFDSQASYYDENIADYTNTLSPKEDEEAILNPVTIENMEALSDCNIEPMYLMTLGLYFDKLYKDSHGENGKILWTIHIDENTIRHNDSFLHFDTHVVENDFKIHVGYSYETGGFELSCDDYKESDK